MKPPNDYPEFKKSHPQDILRWAVDRFQNKLVVVTSFQPTGIVALHMLREIAPELHVISLDTGLLFRETYALIDQLEAEFKLNLQRVQPKLSLEEQAEQYGEALWESAPNQCCYLRKVLPLKRSLMNFGAWISGLRHDQSPQRAKIHTVMWDEYYQLVKISPFSNWTEDTIWEYIETYDLPFNELHRKGFPSIGCEPCTSPVHAGERNSRAGRWVRHDKVECGIHFDLTREDKTISHQSS